MQPLNSASRPGRPDRLQPDGVAQVGMDCRAEDDECPDAAPQMERGPDCPTGHQGKSFIRLICPRMIGSLGRETGMPPILLPVERDPRLSKALITNCCLHICMRMEQNSRMKHVAAVIHKDEAVHMAFTSPMCRAVTRRLTAGMMSMLTLLRHWFEDAVPVEPRGFEDVRELVTADLVAGASLMVVPLIEVPNRKVRANVSMDRGMLRAIDAEAKRRRQTSAAFMTEAARREIEGSH